MNLIKQTIYIAAELQTFINQLRNMILTFFCYNQTTTNLAINLNETSNDKMSKA